MGYSCVYLGQLLNQEQYDRLPKSILDTWITNMNDPQGRYVIHPPGCFVVLGLQSQVCAWGEGAREELTINQDFVLMSDLEKAMNRYDLPIKDLLDVPVKTINQLEEYIAIANAERHHIYVLELDMSPNDHIVNKKVISHVVQELDMSPNDHIVNKKVISNVVQELDMADVTHCRIFTVTGVRASGKTCLAKHIAGLFEPKNVTIVSGIDACTKGETFVWDNVVQTMQSDEGNGIIIFDDCVLDKKRLRTMHTFAQDTKSTVIFTEQYPNGYVTKDIVFLLCFKNMLGGSYAIRAYNKYGKKAFETFDAFIKAWDMAEYDCMVIFDDGRVRWCNTSIFFV